MLSIHTYYYTPFRAEVNCFYTKMLEMRYWHNNIVMIRRKKVLTHLWYRAKMNKAPSKSMAAKLRSIEAQRANT